MDVLLLPSAPGAPPTVADAAQWGDEQLLAVDSLNVPATLAGTAFPQLQQAWRACMHHLLLNPMRTCIDSVLLSCYHYSAAHACWGMAGMPAVSVPVALTAKEGLPLGLQLIAGPLAEARLLAAAHVLEHQAQRHSCAEGGQLAPLKKPGEGKAPLNTV